MLYRLDPFLDREGSLRVGGRIKQASLHEDIKNLVILPKKGHVTELLDHWMQWCCVKLY